ALTSQDVVRHPVVQKIVLAYEEYEKKQNQRARSKDNKRS
ncbi:MAG: phosphate starvation-inducible protein PhoH, partial [Lachnospiraceae bacterium]|nr:phosphate starvation-inducible protein PhoH [Lachnospiraceae bacterium]